MCNACFLQAEATPYGTPYSSVGGFSSLQSTPHSLTGYSPLTHFHGSLGSSQLGTPARSVPSASVQVSCSADIVAGGQQSTRHPLIPGQGSVPCFERHDSPHGLMHAEVEPN